MVGRHLGGSLATLLILLGASSLSADEVTLDDGQTMFGRINKLDDLDLHLSVHYADANVPIRWRNVMSFQTFDPIRIELRDGRAFFANIKMDKDGKVTIQEEGDAKPILTTREELYALEERKGVLDGEVGISGTGASGNLNSASVRFYWDFYYRWEVTDFQFKGEATFDMNEGETTDRSIYAQVRYDYRFGDPAFMFASFEQNHDYFADIESRSVATVGAGTYLLNYPRLVLRTDLGPTYTVSRLREGEDSETPGYRASMELRMKLHFELRLRDSFIYYGNLSETTDWQARNELMLSREVFKGFHLNGGITTTWDHGAAPGISQRDNTYYFGIGYEF